MAETVNFLGTVILPSKIHSTSCPLLSVPSSSFQVMGIGKKTLEKDIYVKLFSLGYGISNVTIIIEDDR